MKSPRSQAPRASCPGVRRTVAYCPGSLVDLAVACDPAVAARPCSPDLTENPSPSFCMKTPRAGGLAGGQEVTVPGSLLGELPEPQALQNQVDKDGFSYIGADFNIACSLQGTQCLRMSVHGSVAGAPLSNGRCPSGGLVLCCTPVKRCPVPVLGWRVRADSAFDAPDPSAVRCAGNPSGGSCSPPVTCGSSARSLYPAMSPI